MSAARAPRGAPPARGSRRFRLTGVGAFDAVFRGARRFDADYVQLLAMPASRAPGRAGLAVGTKALPLAVDRNRVRRLFREALRCARPAVEAYDVILRLKRRCPRADFPRVAAEARGLLDALIARSGS